MKRKALKRKRVNTNEVLTGLCSGEVSGSLTDVEETLRLAKKLVLNLDAQVLAMRADKERREAAEKILAKKRAQAEMNPPDFFCCSVTHVLMVDPVVGPGGHTFEREAITQWLESTGTCPHSRQPCKIEEYNSNRKLRDAIEAYVHGQIVPE